MVFELMDLNVYEYLQQYYRQGMPIDKIRHFMRHLLQGLSFLAEHDVLHRDIKSTNLMICLKTNTLKICDFGMGRRKIEPGRRPAMTPRMGTLEYLAPERLVNMRNDYSCSVDVWSAGIILGEMSNNKQVFPGKSHIDQLHLIGECLGKNFYQTGVGSEQLVVRLEQVVAEKSLQDRFADHLSPSALNLMECMLTFESSQRITASQALEHEFFTQIEQESENEQSGGESSQQVPIAPVA
eukprot:gene42097-52186_t